MSSFFLPKKQNTKSNSVSLINYYILFFLLAVFSNQISAQSGECIGCEQGAGFYDDLLIPGGSFYGNSKYSSLWTELAGGNIGYVFSESENPKVGIGTFFPVYTLDVNGSIRAKDNLTIEKKLYVYGKSFIDSLTVGTQFNVRSIAEFDKDIIAKKDLNVTGIINTSELYVDGKPITGNDSNTIWKKLRGGDIGFVYPDGNDNRVGIGTDSPQFTLDVNGTINTDGNMILSGLEKYTLFGETYQPSNVNTGRILIPGPSSQYLIGVQDGNGRIQHKWNATSGTNEKFLVSNENASFMNWNGAVSGNRWFEFKFANGTGKNAGDTIDWQTHFSIEKNGNVGIGMTTTPTEKFEVNGNIKASRIYTNNLEVTNDSRFKQDVYVDGIISVDEAIYTPKVYTTDNAKFVNLEIGKTILPDGGIASIIKDSVNRVTIYSGNGEEANVSFAPDRTTLYKNVGINKIPNPNYDLDVKGSINASNILIDGESLSNTWTKTPNTTGDIFYNSGNVTIGSIDVEASKYDLNVSGNITSTIGDFESLKVKNEEINFNEFADKTSQEAFQAFTLSALAAIGVNEAFDYFTDKPLEIVDAFTDVIDGVTSLKPQNVKCKDCIKKNTNATLKVLTASERLIVQNNAVVDKTLRVKELIKTPKLLVSAGNNPDWNSEWNDKVNGDGSGYEMVVEGDFIAQRIAVASNFETFQWPDYVFKADYELQPLESVETFIQAKKHLPNVPSEKEVKEEGLDLAEINAILLRKIEELTLYAIDQNKRISNLEKLIKKN